MPCQILFCFVSFRFVLLRFVKEYNTLKSQQEEEEMTLKTLKIAANCHMDQKYQIPKAMSGCQRPLTKKFMFARELYSGPRLKPI